MRTLIRYRVLERRCGCCGAAKLIVLIVNGELGAVVCHACDMPQLTD